MTLLKSGQPVVSMHGKGLKRRLSQRTATNNGWAIVPNPTKGVIAHVSDPDEGEEKILHAESLGIIVLNHESWPAIAPIGHTLKERMMDLLGEANSS